MRHGRFWVMLVPLAGCFLAQVPVRADCALSIVKEALVRRFCHDVYWLGWDYYERGVPWPVEVWIKGERFWARVRAKTRLPGVGEREEIKTYRGLCLRGRAIPENVPREMARPELGAASFRDAVTVPVDCTPVYDPDTPEKERMLEAIVRAVREQLDRGNRRGISCYPEELTLVVGNFNVDYPLAYVLVKESGEVLWTSLEEPAFPRRKMAYMFVPVYNNTWAKELRRKIEAHGLVRRIRISPPTAPELGESPQDLEGALRRLESRLAPETLQAIKEAPEEHLEDYRSTVGAWIDCWWDPRRGPLGEWFRERGICLPEDMITVLLRCLRRRLNDLPVAFDEEVARYKEYYRGKGYDPCGG